MTSLNETAGGAEGVSVLGAAGVALAGAAGDAEDVAGGGAEDAGSCDTEGKAKINDIKNENKPT